MSWLYSCGNPTLRKLGRALAHTAGALFPALLLSFDSCTLATLCVWSLMRKNSWSRPIHTFVFIRLLLFPSTVFIRCLKRRMEISLSWLSSW